MFPGITSSFGMLRCQKNSIPTMFLSAGLILKAIIYLLNGDLSVRSLEERTVSFWILRADHIFQLGNDPRTRQIEAELMLNRGVESGAVFDFIRYSMLFSNGEAHAKRRSAFTKTFAFRMIEALRPEITKLTERLWDDLLKVDDFDFAEMYASKLPALTIASVLGLPSTDAPFFTRLVYKVSRCLSPSWREEEFAEIEASAIELQDYVRATVTDRSRRISDDFLSCYLKAVREEGALSPIEEIMQLVLLILAGSDTTRTAMVMLPALLLQDPVVWSSLCRDQSGVAAAVEEGFVSSHQLGLSRAWRSKRLIWMATYCQREVS